VPAALYPKEDSWYSFLLRAESTQRLEMENIVESELARETEVLGENLPQVHFLSTINPT
jgi:hypothetical protein